ncbi:cyclic nucleotide-binding domain-containing protein [Candidatus Gracilibacteria bacterium]|nr:cyclic nucleotide-binding domain-containing protein [Candidatus Gracilibacteria bacterium]
MDQTQTPNAADSSLLLPILKQIPLFATLDENQHKEIIQHIVMMYYPLNYTLLRQGEEGDALYIIKKGQVDIFKEPLTEGDLPSSLATITDGGFFGEMALVSDVPRNASARTITECEIFILSKTDFKTLLATNTAIAEQISAAMVDRLNANDLTNR